MVQPEPVKVDQYVIDFETPDHPDVHAIATVTWVGIMRESDVFAVYMHVFDGQDDHYASAFLPSLYLAEMFINTSLSQYDAALDKYNPLFGEFRPTWDDNKMVWVENKKATEEAMQ